MNNGSMRHDAPKRRLGTSKDDQQMDIGVRGRRTAGQNEISIRKELNISGSSNVFHWLLPAADGTKWKLVSVNGSQQEEPST